MILPFQRADVVAIQNHHVLQLVLVLLDLVMLHHNDYHIDLAEEQVEVEDLVG